LVCDICGRGVFGFFKERGLSIDLVDVVPTMWSITTSVAVWATLRSGTFEGVAAKGSVEYLISLVGLMGVYGLALLWFERDFLLRCYQTIKSSSTKE
jgi:hypothetical protein